MAALLAIVLAAIVVGVMLRYSDAGVAQNTCMQSPGPLDSFVSESATPNGELSGWPLGLRCVFPAADGREAVLEPDFSLTFVAVASVALAIASLPAWTFGREHKRRANHHRVLERRPEIGVRTR